MYVCMMVFLRVHSVIEKLLILNLTHCNLRKIANNFPCGFNGFVCIQNEFSAYLQMCVYTQAHRKFTSPAPRPSECPSQSTDYRIF